MSEYLPTGDDVSKPMPMPKTKKCIVSYSNGHGNYDKAMMRLEKSLPGNFDGDFYGFNPSTLPDAPTHGQVPYGFKVFAISKAIAMGYELILWLDASSYAIRDISPVFEIIKRKGYFMQESGHYAGSWTNRNALAYFNLGRSEAMKIPMYSAGFTGLNVNNETAMEFFRQWHDAMRAGAFNGGWEDHRHDMSCASIIAHSLGMVYEKGDQYIQYAAPETPLRNESIVLKIQGI